MSYPFSFLFPWLLVFWLAQSVVFRLTFRPRSASASVQAKTGLVSLGAGLSALIVILLPLGGIPLARWFAGLNLLPSIPLLVMLFALVWKNISGHELFSPGEKQAAWIFGAVTGTALYPFSMGLGNVDPYAWGWGFGVVFPIIALCTLYAIWKRSRFGLVLFLAIAAYDLRCLESSNFWDYLADPIYWLLSIVFLLRNLFRKKR